MEKFCLLLILSDSIYHNRKEETFGVLLKRRIIYSIIETSFFVFGDGAVCFHYFFCFLFVLLALFIMERSRCFVAYESRCFLSTLQRYGRCAELLIGVFINCKG